MAIEDGMILRRAFAASHDVAEAFSRYEARGGTVPMAFS